MAAATRAMGRSAPETVDKGGYRLAALPFGEGQRVAAERAVKGFAPDGTARDRRGQGDDFWYRRVNIIKFCFLGDLASGWQNTGGEEYAAAARDYFADFLAYFEGPPWDGAGVRIAVRCINWLDYLAHFLDSELFDGDLLGRIVGSACEQLDHLAAGDKKPGNVRLFQANAFLRGRLLLPPCESSDVWIRQARDIYTIWTRTLSRRKGYR
jgi:hypothetical protein